MSARRRPMSSIRRVFELVIGERLPTFQRVISGCVAVAMLFLGWGPLLNPTGVAYQNPVFDGVKSIAPLETWGFAFWVVGIVMGVAAISGRAMVYVFGLLGALLTLAGWCFAVITESKLNPEANLTSGAIGLYILSGTAVLGLAFSPQQIEHESKIVGIVGQDGAPVPLRRLDTSRTKTG